MEARSFRMGRKTRLSQDLKNKKSGSKKNRFSVKLFTAYLNKVMTL